MTKKDYERAAKIAQTMPCKPTGCYGHIGTKPCPVEAFVELFQGDNPRFDAERFRRACVPGANVKARP